MKRKVPAIVVGVLVPFLWVAGHALGVLPVDLLYGTALSLRGPAQRVAKDGVSPVLLVEIDNPSLDSKGPWPWPKATMQEILQKLSSWGARALVLDPSILVPESVPDPGFWSLVASSTAIAAPLTDPSEGGSPCGGRFPTSLASASGFPRWERGAAPVGLPCTDRFVWGRDAMPATGSLSWPLVGSDGQNLVPTLPVAALLASSPVDQRRSDWWNEGARAIVGARGMVRLNEDGSVYMRPYGAPGSSVARVSAMSILSGELATDQFRDRIVVVGVTASDFAPHLDVPFRAPLLGSSMARPEALANILNNLIEQDQYRAAPFAPFAGLILLPPVWILAVLGVRMRRRWMGVAGNAVVMVLALGGAWFAFHDLHQWIPPLSALLVPGGAMLLLWLWPKPKSFRAAQGDSAARASGRFQAPPRRFDETGTRFSATAPLPADPPDRPTTTTMPVRTVDEATSVVMTARGQDGQIVRGPTGEYVQLGRYIDLKPLAAGGMCKVYEGRDPVMDRRVAIKILRADKSKGQTTEQRFLREAKVAGSLNHPNINMVFDFGKVEDILFLVLEFVDGQTLSQWVREHNGVQPAYILAWVRQIADALDAAHRAQVIHRDIKPSNFMIVNTTGAIKLMDFGVARTPDVTLTQAGTTVGTPNYMSPEQLQGSRVGPLADLYSFGVVVYQILSQRLPFHGEGLTALCNNILKGQATRLSVHRPDLAGPIEEVVHKAFATRPEDRYASCTEFAEAFAKAASR